MKINLNEVKTQDDTKEPAAIDQANERVEAKLKVIEEETRQQVSEGLQEVADRKRGSKSKSK